MHPGARELGGEHVLARATLAPVLANQGQVHRLTREPRRTR